MFTELGDCSSELLPHQCLDGANAGMSREQADMGVTIPLTHCRNWGWAGSGDKGLVVQQPRSAQIRMCSAPALLCSLGCPLPTLLGSPEVEGWTHIPRPTFALPCCVMLGKPWSLSGPLCLHVQPGAGHATLATLGEFLNDRGWEKCSATLGSPTGDHGRGSGHAGWGWAAARGRRAREGSLQGGGAWGLGRSPADPRQEAAC